MPTRYSRIAILLHWLIAAALAFQISLGWGMGRTFGLVQLHKSIGITILLLSLLRLAVRLTKPRPPKAEGGMTGALASLVHFGLYAFMIGAPLTGWLIVSTSKLKIPTLLWGTIPLPHLPVPQSIHEASEGAHGALVWIGIALFVLHVAGAIRHHFLMRDGLIYRMVPARSAILMWLLIALVPVGLFGAKLLPGVGATEHEHDEGSEGESSPAPSDAPENAAASVNAPITTVAVPDNAAEPAEIEDAPPVWTIAKGGKIGFSVGNGDDSIDGGFSRWSADIAMDPDKPETARIRVEIDLASASVGDATQDEMLAGDEFFAVKAHPRAVFLANGAKRDGEAYVARGTLALRGMRKPQAIRFHLKGADMERSVTGSATIARADFNIGDGGSSLSPDVTVNFTFDATGKQP